MMLSSSVSPVFTVICVGASRCLPSSGSFNADDALEVMPRAATVAGDGSRLVMVPFMLLMHFCAFSLVSKAYAVRFDGLRGAFRFLRTSARSLRHKVKVRQLTALLASRPVGRQQPSNFLLCTPLEWNHQDRHPVSSRERRTYKYFYGIEMTT